MADYSYETIYNTGKKKVDAAHTLRQGTDETSISQYNATMDAAAKQATAGYQQSIKQAPIDALEQKNANAIQEAVNRKQVSETMANLGLTDSGLNRTQQTALTLQRGNADAAVDRQTQEYVNSLQMAIDDVMAEYAGNKANYANSVHKATSDWYTSALTELENNSQTTAASLYAADSEAEQAALDRELDKYLGELDASTTLKGYEYDDLANQRDNNTKLMGYEYDDLANQRDNATDLEIAGINAQSKNNEISYDSIVKQLGYKTDYAERLMDNGVPESIAWAGAAVQYPGDDETENAYNAKVYNTYTAMTKSGYSSDEAESIAALVANGNSTEKSIENVLKASVQYIDLSEVTSVYEAPNKNMAKMLGYDSVTEMTQVWGETDWKTGMSGIVKAARENIDKNHAELSAPAKEYAVAVAVGQAVKNSVTNVTISHIYNVICDEFDGENGMLATAALEAAGINTNVDSLLTDGVANEFIQNKTTPNKSDFVKTYSAKF